MPVRAIITFSREKLIRAGLSSALKSKANGRIIVTQSVVKRSTGILRMSVHVRHYYFYC